MLDPNTKPMHERVERIRAALNYAIRGKEEVMDHVLVCLLARGHLLLEDKPGLGKTTLAKALAQSIGGRFARMQCTPDLLPSDITGFNIFNQKTHEFEFRPGPVFADVLLADEINRATPRAQSALLEAMAERQVTVDTVRRPLRAEFFVIATQNPIDQHGTYPLPEAQLDRFAMRLSLGYPGAESERQMLQLALQGDADAVEPAPAALQNEELRRIQETVSRLAVSPAVQDYLVRLAAATRSDPRVALGVSPRGLLMWQRAAQARAFLQGRDFVTPDDVQDVAPPILGVRVTLERDDFKTYLSELLDQVSAPRGPATFGTNP